MSSPGSLKRSNGYESLSSTKPKPPPKPKVVKRAESSPVFTGTSAIEPSTDRPSPSPKIRPLPPPKPAKDSFVDSSPASPQAKPKLAVLPERFKAAFKERNKQAASEVFAVSRDESSRLTRSHSVNPVKKRHPFLLDEGATTVDDLVDLRRISLPPVDIRPEPPPKPSPKSPAEYLVCTPITSHGGSHSSLSDGSITSHPDSPSSGGKSFTRAQPVTFPRPAPREVEYTEREHSKHAFELMDGMRKKGELCDVTLLSQNSNEIRAHRVVLAACSPYFEGMFIGEFSEPEGEPVVIDEVDDEALASLVEFAYTASIKITDRNIYSVFEAADLLQFPGVRGACFKFFKQQMNKSNCIATWLFGEGHNCLELTEAALRYIECNFLDIVRGREFLELEQPEVLARLVALEDIAIACEEQVYEAVLGWLHFSPESRRQHASLAFSRVRFPSMQRDYLLHIVDSEPFIKEDPDCLQQLIDALETHVSSMRATLRRKLIKHGGASYASIMPRAASMAVEVVELERGDRILGLRIMGGTDRQTHLFRQGDKPGIFILQVIPDGAAAECGKLRSGDRILRVGDTDLGSASHEQAIRALKMAPEPMVMLVRHEPPPPSLQELTLVTRPGEGFGFSITGGVNSRPGNHSDPTDEGIFISQVIPGGTCEQDGRLAVGMRILQVNSISMLGRTHEEALHLLAGVLDRMNLLVCAGFEPEDHTPSVSDEDSQADEEEDDR